MQAPILEFDIEKALREILSENDQTASIFDRLLIRFESFSNQGASSIGEIKRRDDKKNKGNAWENFCHLYLSKIMGYYKVWMWKDIPDNIRLALKLKSRVDNGIDIVTQQYENGGYIAVQCKYRKKIQQTVTWTTLSTFVGLCCQTGPWGKQIVMTNCKGVSRKTGIEKTAKDQTIAYGTFKSLCRADFVKCLSGDASRYYTLSDDNNELETKTKKELPKTQEELRALRLAKFQNQ